MKIVKLLKQNWLLFGLAFAILYAIYAVELNNAITLDNVWNFNGVDCILEDGKFSVEVIPSLSLEYILERFSGGRPSKIITDCLYYFLSFFGITVYTRQWFLKIMMMLCLAIAAVIITKIFSKYTKNDYSQYIILILSLISFINPLFIEVWSYSAVEWTLGILCGAIATRLFTEKRYVWAGLLVCLSVGFYESYFENYLILCTAYIFLEYKERNIKETFIEHVKMCLTGVIPVVLDLVCQKLATILYNIVAVAEESVQSSSSIKSDIGLNSLAERIYHYGVEYFTHFVGDVFGYYPNYFLYLILLIIFGATSYIICKKYGAITELYFVIFFILEIIWFLIVFVLTAYWIEARIAWNVFMSLSMMFIVFYVIMESNSDKGIKLFYVSFVIFSFVNIYTTNSKTTDYYISRASDHQYLDSVQAEIERYEESTGIEIKYIYTYSRDDIPQQSEYLLLQANVNAYDRRFVSKSWGDVEALNYYEGENYINLDMTGEEYTQYFVDKPRYGKYVPEDQLVFVNDSLYWDIF